MPAKLSVSSYQSSAGSLAVLLPASTSNSYDRGPQQYKAKVLKHCPSGIPLNQSATRINPVWLTSKGHAMLSISVTPLTCRLKLMLQDTTVIDQDLLMEQGPQLAFQIISPENSNSTCWMLTICPQAEVSPCKSRPMYLKQLFFFRNSCYAKSSLG
jgi:hypothetical protein